MKIKVSEATERQLNWLVPMRFCVAPKLGDEVDVPEELS